MNPHTSWPGIVLAAVLVSCGGTDGGERATPRRPIGEIEPIPVATSWMAFEIRSAVLNQRWNSPAEPGAYWLSLRELPGGCDRPRAWDPGDRFEVDLVGLTDGSCPVGATCEVHAILGLDGVAAPESYVVLHPESATLRVDAFDGHELVGELRMSLVRDPEQAVLVLGAEGDQRILLCASLDGRYRRCLEGPSCCNEGKPLDEVTVPVRASFCPEATTWPYGPGGLEAVAACDPVAGAIDCVAACGGLAALCPSWDCCSRVLGVPGCPEDTVAECETLAEGCLETCRRTSTYPVFDLVYACFASAGSVEGWYACMEGCGGSR